MYAILMKKVLYNNGIVIYNPIRVIKGEIQDGNFISSDNKFYFYADDEYFIKRDEKECVAYVQSKEELLTAYATKNINQALEFFKEDVFSCLNICIFNSETGDYDLIEMPVEDARDLLTVYNGSMESNYQISGVIPIPPNISMEEIVNSIESILKSNLPSEKKETVQNKETVTYKQSESTKTDVKNDFRRDIDTEELEAYLKERIIGQDRQIEQLVTVIAENYKTKNPHLILRPLLIGPSGVGKTETLKLLAEYLKVPFTRYSTPTLSASGYKGNDINDLLALAYQNAGRKIKECEESLIFLDEIDKISSRGRDVSDVAVQNLLLNFLDGSTYDVNISLSQSIKIDTSFMNIVMGGAFEELFKAKDKHVGFISSIGKMKTITPTDIINYGFIAEFVGRASPKIVYNNLSKEDLKTIMTEGKLSPLLLKQQFYQEAYNVALKYDETYVNEILTRVTSNNTGARELSEIVLTSLLDVSRTLQQKSNQGKYSEVLINKEILSDNKVYTLKKR